MLMNLFSTKKGTKKTEKRSLKLEQKAFFCPFFMFTSVTAEIHVGRPYHHEGFLEFEMME